MKTTNLFLIALFGGLLMITSCGKDGPAGPKGDIGASGASGVIGPAGPAGANGQNGSIIYSGAKVPDAVTGSTGDFYLNSVTGLLYGPKTTNGWGTGFSLKGTNGVKGATGAAGANGVAGSQILTGTVVPAADLGNPGDYYLNKTTYLLYGPKIDQGWGTAISLQGPPGTANVWYSGWLYAYRYTDSLIDNSNVKVAHVGAGILNSSLLKTAAVLVYFTYDGKSTPLPYTSNAGGKVNTIAFIPTSKEIIIYRFTHDNSSSIALSGVLQYRFIVIPGGISTAEAKGFDIKDINAVKRYYRIND
ncbi:collagen-like protein [Pedobacter foliorum]|uniref:collagen-like protein n=1 Tax=Pedobacter foliorum TaxID=2739058 RepID=UPI0015666A59|nr:collagen-like protein [Pedobacter foliorum]NRF40094.1 collagen-like protein [Pedobacter foliorum]